jgi:hypothetical protein
MDQRSPPISQFREFAAAGVSPAMAQMSPMLIAKSATTSVGFSQGHLPVVQPTKFEFVISLKIQGARPRGAADASPAPTR